MELIYNTHLVAHPLDQTVDLDRWWYSSELFWNFLSPPLHFIISSKGQSRRSLSYSRQQLSSPYRGLLRLSLLSPGLRRLSPFLCFAELGGDSYSNERSGLYFLSLLNDSLQQWMTQGFLPPFNLRNRIQILCFFFRSPLRIYNSRGFSPPWLPISLQQRPPYMRSYIQLIRGNGGALIQLIWDRIYCIGTVLPPSHLIFGSFLIFSFLFPSSSQASSYRPPV